MKRSFLEGLGLEKEQIDAILDENMADIGKERAIATSRQEEISELENKIIEKETEINALQALDHEGLKTQLDSLQEAYEREKGEWEAKEIKRLYEQRRDAFFKDTRFTDDYTKRGVLAEFDEKGFDFDDEAGTFTDADTWLDELKTTTPTAFMDPKTLPKIVTKTEGGSGGMGITAEQFKSMTYMEKLKFKNEQPEAYQAIKTAD